MNFILENDNFEKLNSLANQLQNSVDTDIGEIAGKSVKMKA